MVRSTRIGLLVAGFVAPALAEPRSVDGIRGLADRLLSGRGDDFEFSLTTDHDNWSRWNQPSNDNWSRWNQPSNDNYTVSESDDGKILVEGTTLSALSRGLRHYATETLQLDEFWFVDGHGQVPESLPSAEETLTGSSIVPWRYNLNTVAFSYTFPWYTWEDWEKLLDWAAWRGVNLQLAWVGYEKIFLDSFRELGMTDDEILPFFSGPAFQAWNRFGNSKGSWGGAGDLPMSWIDSQFDMQKKIVARMVELGITPVLPAFPGFVPDAIDRVRPDADVTRAPDWNELGEYSSPYFLSPTDETSATLQRLFVEKQVEAFGNVTNIYTLDQFNEMSPDSDDAEYLTGVSSATYQALTDANPAAIWLMQGWLFFSSMDFWSQDRIEAYLGGVGDKNGMLILDLYSEAEPQWQRTKSYAGKPWIWCQLHDFGGNMNLFGLISNVTANPIEALEASDSLVGFGLTPEAYEGNEVVYDLLLDQAWAPEAIDTKGYFHGWASLRYGGVSTLPSCLHEAWELLREHVYDSKDPEIPCSGVGVHQLRPSLSGLVDRKEHWPAPTALHYDPSILKQAWNLMLEAGTEEDSLWGVPAFELDLVDVTRQVMTNAFIDMYQELIKGFNSTTQDSDGSKKNGSSEVGDKGEKLLKFLDSMDDVLATNEHLTLDKWIHDAKRWEESASDDLLVLNARGQVTVWFPGAESLNDYSARAWSGLTRSYYRERWSIFVDELGKVGEGGSLNETEVAVKMGDFENGWQNEGLASLDEGAEGPSVRDTIVRVQEQWPDVFKV